MKIIIYFTLILYFHCLYSVTYVLPKNSNRLVGENLEFTIPKNNIYPLEFFAEKFQVGLRNILQANPNTDVYLPGSNQKLIIPHQLILPNTLHTGIIINKAEMRLYYYPEKSNIVIVFPIAIGTTQHETPSQWITSIQHKKKTPSGSLQILCVMNI